MLLQLYFMFLSDISLPSLNNTWHKLWYTYYFIDINIHTCPSLLSINYVYLSIYLVSMTNTIGYIEHEWNEWRNEGWFLIVSLE